MSDDMREAFEAGERVEFENFARKNKMSLTRNVRKPHQYAFGTQKAWEAWMIRATQAQASLQSCNAVPDRDNSRLMDALLDAKRYIDVLFDFKMTELGIEELEADLQKPFSQWHTVPSMTMFGAFLRLLRRSAGPIPQTLHKALAAKFPQIIKEEV